MPQMGHRGAGGAVAKVHRPAHRVGVVQGGAVEHEVVKDDEVARLHGEGIDRGAGRGIERRGAELARLGPVVLNSLRVAAGDELQGSVVGVDGDQRQPHGEQPVLRGVGHVAAVLVPRQRSLLLGGQLGPHPEVAVELNLGADQRLHHVEDRRFDPQLVQRPAEHAAVPADLELLLAAVLTPDAVPAARERLAGACILDQTALQQPARVVVDEPRRHLDHGVDAGLRNGPAHHQIPLFGEHLRVGHAATTTSPPRSCQRAVGRQVAVHGAATASDRTNSAPRNTSARPVNRTAGYCRRSSRSAR